MPHRTRRSASFHHWVWLLILSSGLWAAGAARGPWADAPGPSHSRPVLVAPEAGRFPVEHLLPRLETQAAEFMAAHPEYDGRGVIVAIFDDGLDPGAPGLQTTPDGRPKVIDLIDGTGSGDVPLSEPVTAEAGRLTLLSGRTIDLPEHWHNPTGEYRLGLKPAYEFFPEELVRRLRETRTRRWEERQRRREVELRSTLQNWDREHPEPTDEERQQQQDLEAALAVLQHAREHYDDPGPLFDCVVFHDGEHWRVAIDNNSDGNLSDEPLLTDFSVERVYGTFGDDARLNYGVHIYDAGRTLSIVIPAGSHGTHVAGIVGAYHPEDPARNGVAPGVQFILVKIGDNRMGGMENGLSIVRGLQAVVDYGCDLVNMSYGEPTTTPNRGDLVEQISELVHERGVIFVASAGNSGPALSTVGAPGGTTSATIGVGAYVSQEMMTAQYALYAGYEGVPYTWTSRGPTSDGDQGVDLFAPGGAYAPVPNFTQQPQMQMNGTSMAAPNCCGCIALLLSGLKSEGLAYTPSSVRRALENSALRLSSSEAQAQGAGLVQVMQAWEHLTAQEAGPGEALAFDVSIGGARGVYLREPQAVGRKHELLVSVTPRFPTESKTEERLSLRLDCLLECEADWVKCGTSLVLMSPGEVFRIHVDPTGLDPGVHDTEIRGFDSQNLERGPLFRVPITVIVPEPPMARVSGLADFRAGEILRRFLTVPAGATVMDVRLRLSEADSQRVFLLHPVQLLEGDSGKDRDTLRFYPLSPGGEAMETFDVTGGGTVELCLAQFWSRLGDSMLEYEVTFRGLRPGDEQLTLAADGEARPLFVECAVTSESLAPTGQLTTWRRLLAPSRSDLTLLDPRRDTQLTGGVTSRLLLTYEFDMPFVASVIITAPRFEGLLYDSHLHCYQWMLFDEHQRLLACDDMWPDPVRLESGSYTVHLQLCDVDQEELQACETLTLAVDARLPSPLSIRIYDDAASAAARGRAFRSRRLQPGESARIWLAGPSVDDFPKHLQTGDMLIGTLRLESRSDGQSARSWSLQMPVVRPAEASAAGAAEVAHDDLGLAWKKLRLSHLQSLVLPKDQEEFDRLSRELLEEFPADQEVLLAILKTVDAEAGREERLQAIVSAAEELIQTIDAGEILTGLGRRSGEVPEEGLSRDKAAVQRDRLADALYRKARALAFMELPEVMEVQPINDRSAHDAQFEETLKQLSRWVDLSAPEYVLLRVRQEWRSGHWARALQALNKHLDEAHPERLHLEKRRDLYELLGWEDWRDHEAAWILIRFPDRYVPF